MLYRLMALTLIGILSGLLGACDNPPPSEDVSRIEFPVTGISTVDDSFARETGDWQFFDGTWAYRAGSGEGENNGVLAQTADDLGRRVFPLALWKSHRFAATDASVRFKPISGEMDASGGIVFRASDGGNYYIARANSLEDNIRLYTFIDGKRSQIAGTAIPAPALGEWHRLRAVALGSRIQIYLNGTLYIDHQDETFSEGYVGLWTKADAVTDFDDLSVKGLPVDTE